ncbi:MAG: hypothetical protein Q9219_007517 [cf. Caloplaca sp. 3 TL-2023]
MGRPHDDDLVEAATRRRGPRKDYRDEFVDSGEDQPEFDEEPEERPRRKAASKRQAQRSRDYEGEEDEDDDDDRGKQLVVRKKSKGKEVAKKKNMKVESSDEDSTEEEKKARRKAKRKSKARKNEVITKAAWEAVPREDLDEDFVEIVCRELGHHPKKVLQGVEEDLLLRHTETGEYNIDAFFDQGVFSKEDKKKWKRAVDKLKKSKKAAQSLYCDAVVNPGGEPEGSVYYTPGRAMYAPPGYGPSRRPPPTAVYVQAEPSGGHRRYNVYCRECRVFGQPCGNVFD